MCAIADRRRRRSPRSSATRRAEPGDERCGIGVPAIGKSAFARLSARHGRTAERRGDGADSFWTWRETMYRFALAATPDDVEAIAAQAYVEMLEAGYGAVAEFHYLHHDPSGAPYANRAEMAERIAAAAAATGIGLTLLPVFYAHAGFGGACPRCPSSAASSTTSTPTPRSSQTVVARLPARRSSASRRTRCAPRRPRSSLRSQRSHATRRSTSTSPSRPPKSTPASRGRARVPFGGSSITPRSTRRWCLVHATHVDAGEVLALARSGAVVGLCPITEANLGDGVFPARAFLDAGGRFGVGSDSNVEITVAGELRMLEYAQRLSSRARNVCAERGGSTGAALFAAAAAGGAQALGRPARRARARRFRRHRFAEGQFAADRRPRRRRDPGHMDFRRRARSCRSRLERRPQGRERRPASAPRRRSRPGSAKPCDGWPPRPAPEGGTRGAMSEPLRAEGIFVGVPARARLEQTSARRARPRCTARSSPTSRRRSSAGNGRRATGSPTSTN